MKERARISRRGVGRHSRTLASGKGDPRDHRRENQRQTEQDLDPVVFETGADGRITLKADAAAARRLASVLSQNGFAVGVEPGQNLGQDAQGRLVVTAGKDIGRLDSAAALATVVAKVNELLDALDPSRQP